MFLHPSSLQVAESKPGNCSTSDAVMTTQFLPPPFAEVCILTFMFLNTGRYTNKFQRAPPAGWDMVTLCSGWALCSISCLPSVKSLVVQLPCYFPWGTLGKAFHSAHRWELMPTETQRKPPAWQDYPLPVRAAFMNTQNDDLKNIVKNTHDWNSYLGLLFGDFHLGHRDVSRVLGTGTQHDLPLRISHRCPLST